MERIYGVPLWLMKDYLCDLGGSETEANVIEGADWRAELRKSEPARIGSLVVGRIAVRFSGEEAALDRLLEQLHWKTLRGGG